MRGNEAAVPELHYLKEFEDAVGADVGMNRMESVSTSGSVDLLSYHDFVFHVS